MKTYTPAAHCDRCGNWEDRAELERDDNDELVCPFCRSFEE